MCGIAGLLNAGGRPVDPAVLRRMGDRLAHRGPDDAGIWVDGEAGLAHRRLSILDLSTAGHQPMPNEDGSLHLVFNGEIYNYRELAEELRNRGHRFRSSTDSEVILHLYEEMGADCVHRLRGMFAFALFDARTRTLFGARDRAGIKPFHYHLGRKGFAFASEIKALVTVPEVTPQLDRHGLADLLFCGQPLESRTLLEGIRSIPPGHRFFSDGSRVDVEEYWTLRFDYRQDRTLAAVVDELAQRLEVSVALHCRSDAPLGSHLSGGLDSSTVAAVAAGNRPVPLETFSIRFDGGERFDETGFARLASGHLGTRHHVATPDPAGFPQHFATLLWHLDHPVAGEPGFTYASAARLAADHVKVSLTGHGGDEVFAGYPAQFAVAFGSTAAFPEFRPGSEGGRRSRWARFRRAARSGHLRALLGIGRAGKSALSACTPAEQQWVRLHCSPEPLQNRLLHPRFRRSLAGYCPVDPYLQAFRDAGTDELLDRCLHHDLRTYLPQLLHKEDRMSMAVSLESRVPLLDHELVEFMATVPPHQKVPDGEPKGLLRAAARRWLPAEVVDRKDKAPFPIPVLNWIDGELGRGFRALLAEERSLDRGIFHPAELRDPDLEPAHVLAMANVETWCRLFLDGDGPVGVLPPSDAWWMPPGGARPT